MLLAAMIIGAVLGLGIIGGLGQIKDELKKANEIADTHLGLYAAAYKSLAEDDSTAEPAPEDVPPNPGTHNGGYL